MQISTHLAILVTLIIRREIPFELENRVLGSKDSKLCTLLKLVLLCSAASPSTVTLFCFHLSTKHQTDFKNGKISASSFTKSHVQNPKSQSKSRNWIPHPTSAASSFAIKSCLHSRCCQPEFHFLFASFPLCSSSFGPSVAFKSPPASFQFFLSTQQFAAP